MEQRTLNLTILSANDLIKVGFLFKMQPYVVVSLLDSASSFHQQRQTTPVDNTGNKNPIWNFPLKFTLNDAALQTNRVTLHFQLFSRRAILPDTLIGQVHVSAFDLLSSVGKSASVTHVSYQIRRKTSGRPKGVVSFDYKFGDKFTPAPPPPAAGVGPSVGYPYPYPPPAAPPTGTEYAYPYPPPAAPAAGTGYAYPGPMSGYGYGYGAPQQVVRPAYGGRSNYGMGLGTAYGGRSNYGMGLGTGLLGGALAGLVVGDLVSDMGHDGGDYYDGDGGFDDGGGFDFGGF